MTGQHLNAYYAAPWRRAQAVRPAGLGPPGLFSAPSRVLQRTVRDFTACSQAGCATRAYAACSTHARLHTSYVCVTEDGHSLTGEACNGRRSYRHTSRAPLKGPLSLSRWCLSTPSLRTSTQYSLSIVTLVSKPLGGQLCLPLLRCRPVSASRRRLRTAATRAAS
jgi:hypothetical protein